MRAALSTNPVDRLLLEREYRLRKEARLDLMDYIAAKTPGYEPPHHLEPLADVFRDIDAGRERHVVISVPPQHGKSETCLHGLAWITERHPELRSAYATYAQRFAADQNTRARRIVTRSSLHLVDESATRWGTAEGGRVTWTGIGGPLSGYPIDGVLLIDDAIKNRQEAESATHRERIMGWLRSVAITRTHPGSSIIVLATRWHTDDPSGQLIAEGWEHINLPAVNEAGDALWESQRPLEWLERRRAQITDYEWWSLYMGQPRPREGAVFKGMSPYEELPSGPYVETWGFDAAYTTKTRSDYSVALKCRRYGDELYVVDMVRAQMEARDFLRMLEAYGVFELSWYLSSTEKGLVALFDERGIRVNELPVSGGDKFARSLATAVSWNSGRIHFPKSAQWASAFLTEVLDFTGTDADKHDDVVDALAAAHDTLLQSPVGVTIL